MEAPAELSKFTLDNVDMQPLPAGLCYWRGVSWKGVMDKKQRSFFLKVGTLVFDERR